MNIPVPFDFKGDLRTLLRRCGYHEFNNYQSGAASYVRRLTKDFYPRFHIYIDSRDNQDVINLHLDQKKPSYAGAHAHSGEYDSEVIVSEADRIKGQFKNQIDNQLAQSKPEPKKGFFAKFFSN